MDVLSHCFINYFVVKRTRGTKSSKSDSSIISSSYMLQILDRLKYQQNKSSTTGNYLQSWRQFNAFIIKLDIKPKLWEERVALFAAYLFDKGRKSATIRSYVSAIKSVLRTDGYDWNDSLLVIESLIKACRLVGDKVYVRLPISKNLLEMILFEIDRLFDQQIYLKVMFKALFVVAYYGLMGIGEVTADLAAFRLNHAVRAKDVHLSHEKKKVLLVLHTSKTHGKESLSQKIKFTAPGVCNRFEPVSFFCPFNLVRNYLHHRGSKYTEDDELFFVFKAKLPVQPIHARNVLKLCLRRLGLDESLYDFHSIRAGRTVDLVKKYHFSIDYVKRTGRWKSNAIYKYLKL